jgi:hypothetical protein
VTITLKVDGKNIELNDFVQKILTSTFLGSINSLSGIDENWKKIDVEIKKS